MIIAIFDENYDTPSICGELWQYDYGQILRIQGLDLPSAAEIHFSLKDKGIESVTRIGVTKDSVTNVIIPDSILENGDIANDYYIYAFVYLRNDESGETTKKIRMTVKARPKPEGYNSEEDSTMSAILKAVNSIADGKADGLKYEDNILSLMAGEKSIASVTITGGSGSGTDGREVELQNNGIHIQWRYEGEESWTNLIALEDIKGPAGPAGEKGDPGTITPEQISGAVEEYFASNPIQVGATEEQARQIEKNTQDISKLSDEIDNKEETGTAESKVTAHNTSTDSHNDIRLLIQNLVNKVNALLDSDDETLDQTSEIVTYIKSNKSLIDAITTSKVSVTDIIDNLTTNVANKPLSASQGVVLKGLIDALRTELSGIEIPVKLPNPNTLTFSGAVNGSYDGSEPFTVEIPSGGSEKTWNIIADIITTEDVSIIGFDVPKDCTEFYILINGKYIDGGSGYSALKYNSTSNDNKNSIFEHSNILVNNNIRSVFAFIKRIGNYIFAITNSAPYILYNGRGNTINAHISTFLIGNTDIENLNFVSYSSQFEAGMKFLLIGR